MRFAKAITRVFYRNIEVQGETQRAASGGIIYCVNHVNALVDPAIVQATTTHVLRPLARSGLFKTFYRPLLNLIGAIPIFRAKDKGSDTSQNQDSFRKVYALLAQNENVVIFPEGQSHSHSHLTQLKTGAARIAIGAAKSNEHTPLLVPVGLNFSQKGKFRGDVLVKYGASIELNAATATEEKSKADIKELTEQIELGLKLVTLNTPTWQDMRLVKLLERFFAMRRGKNNAATLGQRFSGLQRIINAQTVLQQHAPEQLRALTSRLRFFERLCNTFGIRSYHLDIEYSPAVVLRFISKALVTLLVVLPIALIGAINGLIPYYLSGQFTKRFAKGADQIDTARILFSLFFFGLFWTLQCAWIYFRFGLDVMLVAVIVIASSSMITVHFRNMFSTIWRNVKVFLIFARKRQLKQYITHKRDELVAEVASLVRLANKLMLSKPVKNA